MRVWTAYFVGAGSIVAAIAVGLGGGIVAGNIMHPTAPKQGPDGSKMERRAEPVAATTTNAPLERIQYVTGSQAFGAMIAAPAQAQDEAKPDTQTTQANAEPPAPQPSQAVAVEPAPASPAPIARPAEQQASTEPSSSPDSAYAKARDSDLKRAATERRRIERHERWVARRHYDSHEPRGMRDRTDWDDVARNVRQDSDTRDVAGRRRGGFPQMRPFDD